MSNEYFNTAEVDLDGLIAWQLYCSIKLHFSNKKFDFIEYGVDEVKLPASAFNKRRDKVFFIRLAEKVLYQERLFPILIANLYHNNKMWIRDFLKVDSLARGVAYRKYILSFKDSFENEIKKLILNGVVTSYKDLYSSDVKTNYFYLLSQKNIHPITASVLNNVFYYKYISNTELSFVYEDDAFYLNRYYSLLAINDMTYITEEYIADVMDI
jgi:hypothetical protein